MNAIFHKTPPVAASVAKNLHVEDQFGKLIWVKVFKNGPSKTCARQSLKNFTWSVFEYLDPVVASCST